MESHFLAYMYRLRYIERWSLMRKVVRENVAEHSFHVALLAHSLGTIAKHVFERSVQMDLVLAAALFHDATEVFTGDIPTPIKHHNATVLENFREIERVAAERLLAMIPDELDAEYRAVLGPAPGLPVFELQLLKAADLLDAYLKCSAELQAGNREFEIAKQETLTRLQDLRLDEVDYFLAHFAPSFARSLDELEHR